jgi:hypothetical protein
MVSCGSLEHVFRAHATHAATGDREGKGGICVHGLNDMYAYYLHA